MIFKKKDGILYCQFSNLANLQGVCHGVFTRKGGASHAPFDSLNTSFDAGDDEKNVVENRRLVKTIMGAKETIYPEQTHGDGIVVLKKMRPGGSGFAHATPKGDAVVTDIPGKFLFIQTADCQAALLADPERRVVAGVHSGWRGSVVNLIGKTVNIMEKGFGCEKKNIFAGVGPSLGYCCAEFVNFKKEIPERLFKYGDKKAHFDFWKMSYDQLCDAGIPGDNICMSKICTKCNADLFFSYRGEKVTGRFASAIGLAQK